MQKVAIFAAVTLALHAAVIAAVTYGIVLLIEKLTGRI